MCQTSKLLLRIQLLYTAEHGTTINNEDWKKKLNKKKMLLLNFGTFREL